MKRFISARENSYTVDGGRVDGGCRYMLLWIIIAIWTVNSANAQTPSDTIANKDAIFARPFILQGKIGKQKPLSYLGKQCTKAP